jgi:hypothetical protein
LIIESSGLKLLGTKLILNEGPTGS